MPSMISVITTTATWLLLCRAILPPAPAVQRTYPVLRTPLYLPTLEIMTPDEEDPTEKAKTNGRIMTPDMTGE